MTTSESTIKAHPVARPATPSPGRGRKWLWGKRILMAGFFIVVFFLLLMIFKKIDWVEVKSALHAYKLSTLSIAFLVATSSFVVLCCYDLLARKYTRHTLLARQILPLAFVCSVFNLNLSWVGGFSSRYRLYSRLGLNTATITRIISFNLVTNWLGYFIVAGAIFSLGFLDLPDNWKIGETLLQIIGFMLLLGALGYFLACCFAKRRSFKIYKQQVTLPTFKIALNQAGLAITNWCLMALIIFVLFLGKVPYPTILGVLLISSIAGIITHIPGGLGVIETVFLAMLDQRVSNGTILAALIGYRFIYFLIPLAIAFVVYLVLESRAKKMSHA